MRACERRINHFWWGADTRDDCRQINKTTWYHQVLTVCMDDGNDRHIDFFYYCWFMRDHWNYILTTPFYSDYWSSFISHSLLTYAIKRLISRFLFGPSIFTWRNHWTLTIVPSIDAIPLSFKYWCSSIIHIRYIDCHAIWLWIFMFIIIYVTCIERFLLFRSHIE